MEFKITQKTITLVVGGKPVPWHRPGRNKFQGTTFLHNEDRVWQNHVRTQAIIHRPRIVPVGAVILDITFWMPRPKKHKPGVEYHFTKRPDLDNLTKNIKDALTDSMYKDDSQVISLKTTKIFVPEYGKPGAIITLTYLEDDQI